MRRRDLLKLIVGVSLVAVMAISIPLVSGCTAPGPAPTPEPTPTLEPTPEELETFTLKGNVQGVAGGSDHINIFKPWADYIESATRGRCTVDLYTDGALASWGETYPAIESGLADFGFFWCPIYSGMFPLMDLWSLAGFPANELISNQTQLDLERKYPEIIEQFSEVEYITSVVCLRQDLFSREPIRTVDDLKGKIIACQTDKAAEVFGMLGAGTTVILGPDVYMAGQKGVIDGAIGGVETASECSYLEVLPYHIRLGLTSGAGVCAFNKEAWDKFTPTEQMLLKEYRYELISNNIRGNAYTQYELYAQVPLERDIVWSEEDMRNVKALFRPLWDEWAEEMEGLGYSGKDILKDACKWLEAYTHG